MIKKISLLGPQVKLPHKIVTMRATSSFLTNSHLERIDNMIYKRNMKENNILKMQSNFSTKVSPETISSTMTGSEMEGKIGKEAENRQNNLLKGIHQINNKVEHAMIDRLAPIVSLNGRKLALEKWSVSNNNKVEGLEALEPLFSYEKTIHDLQNEILDLSKQKNDLERKLRLKEQTLQKVPEVEKCHPIFGILLKDFKYKKVYCSSVNQLSNIPMWEQQRILRKERSELIAKEKRKAGFPVKIPGIITLFEVLPENKSCKENNKRVVSTNKNQDLDSNTGKDINGIEECDYHRYKLLDGQHRLEALRLLTKEGILNGKTNYVLVEVFSLKKESEAKQLFTEINSAQPVKLIDMPDEANVDQKAAIDEAVEALKDRYKIMFKASCNCKAPHVNQDNLRNDIFTHNIMERHDLRTGQQLLAHILRINSEVVGKRSTKEWEKVFRGKNTDTTKKNLEKATKNNFFLGLDRSWLIL